MQRKKRLVQKMSNNREVISYIIKKTRIIMICFLFIALYGCSVREPIVQIITPAVNGDADRYSLLGEEAYQNGDYINAIDLYLKAVEAYSASYPDGKEVGLLYFVVGQCHNDLTQYRTAIEYFEKSLAIGEKIQDEELCFESYKYLLNMKVALMDSEEDLKIAVEYGEKAERIAKRLYGRKSAQLAGIYLNIGEAYLSSKKYDESEDYFRKAIKIYGENQEGSAFVYCNIAELYDYQGKYEEEKSYLLRAIKIFEECQNIDWLAGTYRRLGVFYHEQKNYKEALAIYKKGLELYSNTDKKDFTLASLYNNRGTEYYNLKEFEKFKEDMKTSYQICSEIPSSELVEELIATIKRSMKVYYDYFYNSDKSAGFDSWFEKTISGDSPL